jgi:multiple sugar transport system ATP-binding protein
MAKVSFRNATRYYPGVARPAVDRLHLEVTGGEFLVLVGPSGCGKSTTLRMLAGLEGVDEGSIAIGDRDVTDLPPKDRDIAMVFQNYALYPHMSVRENIAFHLKIQRIPKAEIGGRVDEAARLLDLAPYLERRPGQLSGGQRQRVAMGRAIVRRPKVFLMDEPLSNLDAKLRVQTRTQIASLQRTLEVTTVYVTHDQVEAMTMGDRVAVLDEGVLQQCDTPTGLYTRPINVFVAGFIGSPAMNLMEVPLREGARGVDCGRADGGGLADGGGGAARAGAERHALRLGGLEIPLTREQRAAVTGDAVVVGVRPEGLDVVDAADGIPATVDVVEELGSDTYLYCAGGQRLLDVTAEEPAEHDALAGDGGEAGAADPDGANAGRAIVGEGDAGVRDRPLARPLTVRTPGMSSRARGDRVGLRPKPGALHLFDAATGRRLPD